MTKTFTVDSTLGDLRVTAFGTGYEVQIKEDFGNTSTLLLTTGQLEELIDGLNRVTGKS